MTEQLELAPVHRLDPDSSREAAARVMPQIGSQLEAVFGAILVYGPDGASNREIQLIVCAGHNPGHPLWNKVPTRARTLERRGLIELVTDDDGEPFLRPHWSSPGQRFLVWRVAP